MLVVQETSTDVFAEIAYGASFVTDGVRHSWQVAELWSDADLNAIGVYRVAPATIPEGKQVVGVSYAREGEEIVQVLDLEDIPPPPLPESVSKLGLKRAMAELEMWTAVKAAIASDPDVQEEWDLAVEIKRTDPLVQGLIVQLALTEPQVDALIVRAHQLV